MTYHCKSYSIKQFLVHISVSSCATSLGIGHVFALNFKYNIIRPPASLAVLAAAFLDQEKEQEKEEEVAKDDMKEKIVVC